MTSPPNGGVSTPAQDAFRAGFGPVMVPVSRPDAPVFNVDPKSQGKAPAILTVSGWKPVDCRLQSCDTETMAAHWDQWGANVGLACGRETHLIGIDSDIDDVTLAAVFRAVYVKHYPFAPLRGVDDPGHVRVLLPLRVSTAVAGVTLLWTDANGQKAKVEILSDGRQFVAWGVHPGTRRPYVWTPEIVDQIDGIYVFPETDQPGLAAFFGELDLEFSKAGWTRGAGTAVSAPIAGAGPVRTATEGELIRWLTLVPNADTDQDFDDRDSWIGMAHAIYGASEGQPWGRDLWLQWCEQRSQRPGEPERVWDTLKGARVGLDWIREKARIRDPKQAAQLDFEFEPVDEDVVNAIADGAAAGRVWPHLQKRYAYVASQDRFIDLIHGVDYTRSGFDGKFSHYADKLKSEFGIPKKKQRRVVDMVLDRPEQQRVDNLTYRPGFPVITVTPDGAEAVNTWREAKFVKRPVSATDVQIWLAHVEFVLGSKSDADLFVKWLVFALRYPHLKPSHHPLIISKPGVGKDSIMAPVLPAFGDRNHVSVEGSDLSRNWNDYLEHRLIVVSEAKVGGMNGRTAHSIANEMKRNLTAPPRHITVETKGRKKYAIANCSAWVFFTNENIPLYVEGGDRRYWVIDNSTIQPRDATYYVDLHAWIDTHPFHVANYLMQQHLTAQDLKYFQGPAPLTQAKQALIDVNKTPVQAALEEIIEEAQAGESPGMLVNVSTDLLPILNARMPRNLIPSLQIVYQTLRQLGASPLMVGTGNQHSKHARLVRSGSDRKARRLWLMADVDAQGRDWRKADVKAVAATYGTNSWPAATTSTGNTLSLVGEDIV